MSVDLKVEGDETIKFLNFNETKKKILLFIKKNQSVDLTTLASYLELTKMGVHKHISELEDLGLIERFKNRDEKSVGRPKLFLRLGPQAANIFPKAYTSLTCSFLRFISERLGDDGVLQAFENRKTEVIAKYSKSINGKNLESRVKQLAKIRNADGYMVDLKTVNGTYELLEYNCPIALVADDYEQACQTEHAMFEELLGTDIDMSHRIVAGDKVCRFKIKNN